MGERARHTSDCNSPDWYGSSWGLCHKLGGNVVTIINRLRIDPCHIASKNWRGRSHTVGSPKDDGGDVPIPKLNGRPVGDVGEVHHKADRVILWVAREVE
jgi:hypothetical protein